MNSMALAMSLYYFSKGMQKSNEWQTRNSALHVCAGSSAFTVHMIVFANVVPSLSFLPLCFPAAGVSTAVGLPAAAPAGTASPAAASAQPSKARAALDPARTD